MLWHAADFTVKCLHFFMFIIAFFGWTLKISSHCIVRNNKISNMYTRFICFLLMCEDIPEAEKDQN